MFIWGSRSKTHTEGEGEFYCPECQEYRLYEYKKAKQYFTVYFIRTFPTEDLGEFVECSACKSTFDPKVLEYDPEKEQEKIRSFYFYATLNIMVFIALADGTVDDEEIEEIKNMFEQITTLKLERKEILESIDDLKNNEHSIKEIATGISPYLSNEGKETVLRGAIAISKADGIVVDNELQTLHGLADYLSLPKAYANGIFVEEGIECK